MGAPGSDSPGRSGGDPVEEVSASGWQEGSWYDDALNNGLRTGGYAGLKIGLFPANFELIMLFGILTGTGAVLIGNTTRGFDNNNPWNQFWGPIAGQLQWEAETALNLAKDPPRFDYASAEGPGVDPYRKFAAMSCANAGPVCLRSAFVKFREASVQFIWHHECALGALITGDVQWLQHHKSAAQGYAARMGDALELYLSGLQEIPGIGEFEAGISDLPPSLHGSVSPGKTTVTFQELLDKMSGAPNVFRAACLV